MSACYFVHPNSSAIRDSALKIAMVVVDEAHCINIHTIRGNLLRPNLHLFVIAVGSEDEKMVWLAQNLPKIDGKGLVYAGTRVNTTLYARWFEPTGIVAACYNASIDPATKAFIEQNLMNNNYKKCVVSTNALEMGIDKPDVRFVVHTHKYPNRLFIITKR